MGIFLLPLIIPNGVLLFIIIVIGIIRGNRLVKKRNRQLEEMRREYERKIEENRKKYQAAYKKAAESAAEGVAEKSEIPK